MDGSSSDLSIRRKKSFKERMWLKGMGCCGGPIWGFHTNTITVDEDDQVEGQPQVREDEGEEQGDSEIHHQLPQQHQLQPCSTADVDLLRPEPGCLTESPSSVSRNMNLAAALAAERHYRASQEPEPAAAGATGGTEDGVPAVNATPTIGTAPGTPFRVSLMKLLEEADGGEEETAAAAASGGGCDSVCCVCMGRKKGAAFIPCGHTYCRVCSRELWLNRGSCPLCNRPILEILDIF